MENHQNNKDLKIEVTTPVGRAWLEELDRTEEAVAKNKVIVEIQENIIELGKKRIKEEKQKLK